MDNNAFESSSVRPNFLNPELFPDLQHGSKIELIQQNTLPIEEGFQADEYIGVSEGKGSHISIRSFRKRSLFAWYFLGCGLAALAYVLFPFFPSLSWEFGKANDRVKEQAVKSAASEVLVEQYSGIDIMLGYVPDNRGTNRSEWIQNENREGSVQDTSPKSTAKTTSSRVLTKKQSPTIKSIAPKLVQAAEAKTSVVAASEKLIQGYRIVIPAIKVDAPIVEGGEKSLEKGVWHLPGTAFPGEGNMALSAHRQKWFYHLDKLKAGDEVVIFQNGKKYQYIVRKQFKVKPEDTSVLSKTADARLTLITCEPLVAMTERIIVVAELMES